MARACLRAFQPVAASMRRVPAAMPLSDQDDETARLAGAVQMRAAAKLYGLGVIRVADGHHAHGVAVLFAEERHSAHVDGGLLAMSLAVNG